jgi:hypothetical protein
MSDTSLAIIIWLRSISLDVLSLFYEFPRENELGKYWILCSASMLASGFI